MTNNIFKDNLLNVTENRFLALPFAKTIEGDDGGEAITAGHDSKSLFRELKDLENFCNSNHNDVVVLNVWESLIEAQRNTEFVRFMKECGYSETDIEGYITGWDAFKHLRPGDDQTLKSEIEGFALYFPSVIERENTEEEKTFKKLHSEINRLSNRNLKLKLELEKGITKKKTYHNVKVCGYQKPYISKTSSITSIDVKREKALRLQVISNQIAIDKLKKVIQVQQKFIKKNFNRSTLARLNPYKCFYDTKGAVSRTVRKIERLDTELVYSIDLTLPKEISFLGYVRPDSMRDTYIKLVKEFFEWLRVYFDKNCRLGVNVNVHLWSSDNPNEPHYHSHNILIGEYLLDGIRNKIPASYFIEKDLKTKLWKEGSLSRIIKNKWTEIVNREFETHYKQVDVYFEFIELKDKNGKINQKGYRKLLHKLKYNKRRPISDLALYYQFNKFGGYFKQLALNWSKYLIEYENRSLTLGFWNRISKLPGAKPIASKKSDVRCPLCYRPLIYVGFHSGRELPKGCSRVVVDRKNRIWLDVGRKT